MDVDDVEESDSDAADGLEENEPPPPTSSPNGARPARGARTRANVSFVVACDWLAADIALTGQDKAADEVEAEATAQEQGKGYFRRRRVITIHDTLLCAASYTCIESCALCHPVLQEIACIGIASGMNGTGVCL